MRSPRVLALDPTPAGLVGDRSLRKAFKYQWKKIRDQHFKERNFACEVCQAVEQDRRLIHSHEAYSFPNPDFVKLENVLFICTRCHDAIHLERTRYRCHPPYIKVVEEHYRHVNGDISQADLEEDFKDMLRSSSDIRKLYGGPGAKPALDFGIYQAGVAETLERTRNRSITEKDDDGDFEMFPDHECPWDMGNA